MMTSDSILEFRNAFAQMVAATEPPWPCPAFAVFGGSEMGEDGHERWQFDRFHIDPTSDCPWSVLIENKDIDLDSIALVAEYRPQNCRATQFDVFQLGRYTGILGVPVWDFIIVGADGQYASVCETFPEVRDTLFCKGCGHYEVGGFACATYQPIDPVEWTGCIFDAHELDCEVLTARMAEMPAKDQKELKRWRAKAAKCRPSTDALAVFGSAANQ